MYAYFSLSTDVPAPPPPPQQEPVQYAMMYDTASTAVASKQTAEVSIGKNYL